MLRFILLSVFFIGTIHGARILGVFPIPSYSHQIVFRQIWRELALQGHDLVILTTDPLNDPSLTNVKEIDWSYTYTIWREDFNISHALIENKYNLFKFFDFMNQLFYALSEYELGHPDVQILLNNKTEHFDLVLVEYLYPPMFAFSYRFKCPYVGITSLDLPSYVHEILGNPTHPILYPDFMLPFEGDLSFFERVFAVILTAFFKFVTLWNGFQTEKAVVKKYFGDEAPEVIDLIKNVSVMLINVDPTFYLRPLGPNIIPIGGGAHLETPKPLPLDIQEFLDSATNGVIYFSLGTNVKESNIDSRMREIFLNTFKKLPYKVLWKWGDELPDKPENVKAVKWMSQQDVLRHPNIKCFITQGGLQSTEEAIFANIPLVGIPYFGDQESNVNKMEKRGFGVALDKNSLTEEKLTQAIKEVINNPKYKNKMIDISKLSKDVQFTGKEKAVWWIEYVLRHKGAKQLRNPAMDVPTYQSLMLDVILFLVVSISILVFLIFKIIKFILTRIFSRKIKRD